MTIEHPLRRTLVPSQLYSAFTIRCIYLNQDSSDFQDEQNVLLFLSALSALVVKNSHPANPKKILAKNLTYPSACTV